MNIAIALIIAVAFVGLCVWLNISQARTIATMTPEDREQFSKGGDRITGDW